MDTWLEASSDWVSRIELESVAAVMAACRAAPGDQPAREFDSGSSSSSDPQVAALERITRAWVGLCEGRDADSITDAMAGAEHATGYAVMAYPLAMRAAVWSGDAARATAAISAFEAMSIHGAAVEATRHGMRSGMAALEGRRQDAVDHAVEALERWWNLGARFEYALAVIDASVAGGAIAAVARAACRDGARHPRGARRAGAGRSLGSPGPARAGARSR